MKANLTCLIAATVLNLGLTVQAGVAAVTVTANLSVVATVLDTCILTTGSALAFSTITPQSATNETVPGSIQVICSATRSSITVTLGAGSGVSSGQRRMVDGSGNYLPYTVHSDTGHTHPVAVGGEIYNGAITSAVPLNLPVYGQIPSGSYATGAYADTVLVTLTY